MAAGLAMTAAALVAAAPGDTGRARAQAPGHAVAPDHTAAPHPATPAPDPAPELVTAPVRIADAATVRLLRPGDHVDVVAAGGQQPGTASRPQVVAAGARVVEIPRAQDEPAGSGALVVLSVPRPTATRLAGAGATSRLAVTLC